MKANRKLYILNPRGINIFLYYNLDNVYLHLIFPPLNTNSVLGDTRYSIKSKATKTGKTLIPKDRSSERLLSSYNMTPSTNSLGETILD